MAVLLLAYYLLCAIVYYVWKITPMISWVILLAPLAILVFWRSKSHRTTNSEQKAVSEKALFIDLFTLITIGIDLFLIAILFLHRTDGLLVSPWQALSAWFFIFFAISSFLLFLSIQKNTVTCYMLHATCSIHLFLMFGIAAILYKFGFGFDAFIHRATEIWIQNNGFILPKNPYYIGQYSFVVWLSNITQIPIFYIDVYLVPVLAAITLPVVITKSLKAAWDIPYSKSLLTLWLIPFVPFLSFHLTTPYNLALLFTVLCVFTMLPLISATSSTASYRNVSILLSLSALLTHPLIGAPLMLFVASLIVMKKYRSIWLVPLHILGTAALLPALFAASNIRAGAAPPTLVNPLTHLGDFFKLFARPYWYADHSPLRFELLYMWQLFIVPIALVLCVVGFCVYRKQNRSLVAWIYLSSAVGLFISAWLLVSWIHFADVVAYEQGDYPMRLVKASLIFLLPFGMYALGRFQISDFRFQILKKYQLPLLITAVLLTLSLYFSYPQRNIKARFPGYNVTASHFKAVEWIAEDQYQKFKIKNKNFDIDYFGSDYIVLADQLTSAAALTKYSFAKYYNTPLGQVFYYSIPTGGIMYQYYGKMIYEGQKREYMIETMDLVEADTAYFVVNSYWANSDKIVSEAKKTADAWQEFDDGRVSVFVYRR